MDALSAHIGFQACKIPKDLDDAQLCWTQSCLICCLSGKFFHGNGFHGLTQLKSTQLALRGPPLACPVTVGQLKYG